MDLEEFEDLVGRHGDDIERWPQERRAAARALVARSEAARALVDAEAELRRLFAREPRVVAPTDLAARIMARAEPATARRPDPLPTTDRPPRDVGPPRDAGPLGGAGLTQGGGRRFGAAAALAACFFAGVMFGTTIAGGAGESARVAVSAADADLFAPLVQ
jgi:hypothetical protein